VIVQEASSIFQGIHQQVADMVSKQVTNGSTLLNHTKPIMKLQEESKNYAKRQDDMEEVIQGIQNILETLPTKSDLLKYTKAMDKQLAIFQEVNTGLTTHLEEYKISESAPHKPESVQAGPSNKHPDRQTWFRDDDSESWVTQDTREEAAERYGFLSGGNGNDDGSDNPEVPKEPSGPPGGPPGPPGPTPPDRRRRKTKPEVTPLKLKDPFPLNEQQEKILMRGGYEF